jgi:hypothetical protein
MQKDEILDADGKPHEFLFVCAYCELYGLDPEDLFGFVGQDKYCLDCEDKFPESYERDPDLNWKER